MKNNLTTDEWSLKIKKLENASKLKIYFFLLKTLKESVLAKKKKILVLHTNEIICYSESVNKNKQRMGTEQH